MQTAEVIRFSDYEKKSRNPDAAGPRGDPEPAIIIVLPMIRVEREPEPTPNPTLRRPF